MTQYKRIEPAVSDRTRYTIVLTDDETGEELQRIDGVLDRAQGGTWLTYESVDGRFRMIQIIDGKFPEVK